MNAKLLAVLFCCLINTLLTGCARGVTDLKLTHSPLKPVAQQRAGTILVHQFTDSRVEDQRYIGTKRNLVGMPSGNVRIKGEKRPDEVVTELFVEALKHAGYEVIIQPKNDTTSNSHTNVNAVLRGDIKEFWLDFYAATWLDVVVDLKLSNKENTHVLLEKTISGDEMNILWLRMKSELEKVVHQALDNTLNNAATEFASEEFYQQVKGNN